MEGLLPSWASRGSGAPDDEAFDENLRNSSVRSSMSTFAVLYPASSQALVITLFVGLLDHQARCLKAEGGNFVPRTFSISSKVI